MSGASSPRVVILGGGLSAMSAAYELATAGWRDITILEREAALGGLASSFEHEGRFYPLGYHHILSRDRTLLSFLELVGVLPAVKWRKVRMLFEAESGLFDFGNARDFLAFPLPWLSKLRFLRLMARSFVKSDWSDWSDRSAADLVDSWADPVVRHNLFEPLVQLKFSQPCSAISAEWLGTRLNYREGAAPLGYVPDANWTKLLCDGLEDLLRRRGVAIRSGAAVSRLNVDGGRASSVTLEGGETLQADIFINTIPPPSYVKISGDLTTPHVSSMRFSAVVSMVCATKSNPPDEFYWLNLATMRHRASGLFNLSALNPTIGDTRETCLNFVTHLASDDYGRLFEPEDQIVAGYVADYRRIFAQELHPDWVKVTRIPLYSPVFSNAYRPPPAVSAVAANVYFAGNYWNTPTIASTGSALRSGQRIAQMIVHNQR